jgi:antitoxin (DNA-binding transcriptional repressor) of toxin-antitoxin stability system
MDASIGAFEVKAQLSRLLRVGEQGVRFTIPVRGRPMADLVPHRAEATQAATPAVAALQAAPRIRGVSDAEVASFVSEGRM